MLLSRFGFGTYLWFEGDGEHLRLAGRTSETPSRTIDCATPHLCDKECYNTLQLIRVCIDLVHALSCSSAARVQCEHGGAVDDLIRLQISWVASLRLCSVTVANLVHLDFSNWQIHPILTIATRDLHTQI